MIRLTMGAALLALPLPAAATPCIAETIALSADATAAREDVQIEALTANGTTLLMWVSGTTGTWRGLLAFEDGTCVMMGGFQFSAVKREGLGQ